MALYCCWVCGLLTEEDALRKGCLKSHARARFLGSAIQSYMCGENAAGESKEQGKEMAGVDFLLFFW